MSDAVTDPISSGVPAQSPPTPYESFLAGARAEAAVIDRDSSIAHLVPVFSPATGALPHGYSVTLRGLEHFVRRLDGTVEVSSDDVTAEIRFPESYLRSTDPHLGFRVVRMTSPLFHPNCAPNCTPGDAATAASAGVVCLGTTFRPGTRLRALIFRLYRIVAGKDFATDSPLDGEASRFFVENLDRVESLASPPLWRAPMSRRVDRDADVHDDTQDPCS